MSVKLWTNSATNSRLPRGVREAISNALDGRPGHWDVYFGAVGHEKDFCIIIDGPNDFKWSRVFEAQVTTTPETVRKQIIYSLPPSSRQV